MIINKHYKNTIVLIYLQKCSSLAGKSIHPATFILKELYWPYTFVISKMTASLFQTSRTCQDTTVCTILFQFHYKNKCHSQIAPLSMYMHWSQWVFKKVWYLVLACSLDIWNLLEMCKFIKFATYSRYGVWDFDLVKFRKVLECQK